MTSVFAHAFAEHFFINLFSGCDVGTALLRARRFFLNDDLRNPLGLAYTLYGRATVAVCQDAIVPPVLPQKTGSMTKEEGMSKAETDAVISAAEALQSKSEDALLLEIGLRDKAISENPTLSNNPTLPVEYDSSHMGLIDDVKALGHRIMTRWNKELYGVVCGKKAGGGAKTAEDKKLRDDVLNALNLGDAAIIAAVAAALITLGAPAAIAAPVAPFLVKKFITPAKEELCDAWGEAL